MTIDDDLYPKLSKYRWCRAVRGGVIYAVRNILRKGIRRQEYLHHAVLGKVKSGHVVDHIDGNGLNNTLTNLRVVTQSVNTQRGRKWGDCPYRGVVKRLGKWRARIFVRGKNVWLGTYGSAKEAARVYNLASSYYFGKWSYMNEV